MLRKITLVASATLLIALPVRAQSPAPDAVATSTERTGAETLIQGFAKWQASRVERMALNEVVGDIADNEHVQRYFPLTAQAIRFFPDATGKRLLPVIQYAVRSDLREFEDLSDCLVNAAGVMADGKVALADRGALLHVVLHELADLANKAGGENTAISDVRKQICEATKDKPASSSAQLNLSYQEIEEAATALQLSPAVQEALKRFVGDDATMQLAYLRKLLRTFVALAEVTVREQEIVAAVRVRNAASRKWDLKTPVTVRVYQILQLLDALGVERRSALAFWEMKDTALFLAELVDAGDSRDPDVVVKVLDSYVDTQDALKRKRALPAAIWVSPWNKDVNGDAKRFWGSCFTCGNTLFFASYFGAAGRFGGGENHFAAFGPVGIEYKIANLGGGPVTIGYAPIDVGAYVTAELQDEAYDPKLSEIRVTTAWAAYSFASSPFTILAGMQTGVHTETETNDQVSFLAVAFDLPIWALD